MSDAYLLVILALLTFLSGYFSASEIALFSLSSAKVKTYRTVDNTRKRLIAHLLQHPRDLLVTIFMLNSLVNILLQNVASHMFGPAASWSLKVGFPLILTLVFGEIIPKYLGMQNNAAVSYRVAPTINFFQNLLQPLRKFTVTITAPISRFLFFFLKREESISKEELEHVLKTSESIGVLNKDEANIVGGYLNLQDSTIKEFMYHREDVAFYDIEEPLSKLIYLLVDQECEQFPVCEGDLQNILGIITGKQYFLHRASVQTPADLIPYLTKTYYVPENTPAHVLLHRFEKEDMYFAVVVDEYGAISGTITRENLLEVVIGKVIDGREDIPLYTKAGNYEIIASGKLELNTFNDLFSCDLTSPNHMVTIAGWLLEKIGDFPKNGEKYEFEGFLFHILASEPNKIKRLYIQELKKPTPPFEPL